MADAPSDDDSWGHWEADTVPPSSNDESREPVPEWAGGAQWSVNRWQRGQSDQAGAAASTETAASGWPDNTWGSCGWHEPAPAQRGVQSWSSTPGDEDSWRAAASTAEAGSSKTKAAMAVLGTSCKASRARVPAVRLVPAASVPKQLQSAAVAGPSSSKAVDIRGSAAPIAGLVAPRVSNAKVISARRLPARAAPIKPARANAAPAKAVPFKAAPARPVAAPIRAAAAPAVGNPALAKPTAAPARTTATAAPAVAKAALANARPPPLPWPPRLCLPTGHSLHLWEGGRYISDCCFLCKELLTSKGLRCQKCESLFCTKCCKAAVSPVQQPVSPPLQQPVQRSATATTSEPAAAANDEVMQTAKRRRLILLDEPPSAPSSGTPVVPRLYPGTSFPVPQSCPPHAAASTSSSSSALAHRRTLLHKCVIVADLLDYCQYVVVVHMKCPFSNKTCCRRRPPAWGQR